MRPLFPTALLLALTAVLPSVALGATSPSEPLGPRINIGHRGASGIAPEHTFPAYDRALESGADYIEQDLQQTSDGVLVVLHDETLDRTARGPAENCTGPVRSKTLEQIKTCDVGSWFNEEYPDRARRAFVGLRIPTLEQVFRRYGRRTPYYIETKSPTLADRMEERLLELLREYELRDPAVRDWRVLVQSFSPDSLEKLHALDPELPLVQLYLDDRSSGAVRSTLDAARTYAVGIGPSQGAADSELVAEAHERCLAVHPYTVNAKVDMRALLALGVDGMFTNFPRRLDEVLGSRLQGRLEGTARAARVSRECRANETPSA